MIFFSLYVILTLACLSSSLAAGIKFGPVDERRRQPLKLDKLDKQEERAARIITGTGTEKTRQKTLCVIGDEKGNVEHLRLLVDQSEKNGHGVKIFQSEKDAIGVIKYCSALFAFQRGDVEYRLRDEIVRLDEDVRVNHIQGTDVLTSKKELMELGLDFVPERRDDGGVPVIRKKPTHGGVEVMLSGDTLKKSESMYQRYIDNALQIDGMPFDYGVYVFHSETHYLDGETKQAKLTYEVWNDVMLRFATNGQFVESTYTNAWSMPSLVNASSPGKDFQAKMAFARYLGEEKSKALFETIDRRIEDAFKAARPYLSNAFTTTAFSLLRFDFVIDDNYFPWLIEVNASPNIKPSSKGQEKMLIEMLDVVSKKLFALEEDIVLSHELTRETDIRKKRYTRKLAQSEYTDVDCVVSDWTAYKPSICADPCYASNHTQVRSRSITTPQRSNGAACPHLIDSRVTDCPNECPPPTQPSPPPSPPPPSPSPPPQWNYANENGAPIVFTTSSSTTSTSSRKKSLKLLVFVVACVVLMM